MPTRIETLRLPEISGAELYTDRQSLWMLDQVTKFQGKRLRWTFRADTSYPDQSLYRLEMWTEMGWTELWRLPGRPYADRITSASRDMPMDDRVDEVLGILEILAEHAEVVLR